MTKGELTTWLCFLKVLKSVLFTVQFFISLYLFSAIRGGTKLAPRILFCLWYWTVKQTKGRLKDQNKKSEVYEKYFPLQSVQNPAVKAQICRIRQPLCSWSLWDALFYARAVKNHHLQRPINESISLLRLKSQSSSSHLFQVYLCVCISDEAKIFLFFSRWEVEHGLVPERRGKNEFPMNTFSLESRLRPSFVTQPFHSDLHFSLSLCDDLKHVTSSSHATSCRSGGHFKRRYPYRPSRVRHGTLCDWVGQGFENYSGYSIVITTGRP